MIINIRPHYFPEGDTVFTGLTPKGDYVAYVAERPLVRGHGYCRFAAIADLNKVEADVAAADEETIE